MENDSDPAWEAALEIYREAEAVLSGGALPPAFCGGPLTVETMGGPVKVVWDNDAPVTRMGQIVFFTEFLMQSGHYAAWVDACPVSYGSPNSPTKADVLGTAVLSILAGHWRYAHATAIRGESEVAKMLGMRKIVSEDSLRRMFLHAEPGFVDAWQRAWLVKTVSPLLVEKYILDIDTTVKPLHGRQEGAKIGYNPAKPGRPSHVYHTYFVAAVRMILDSEVRPGDESAASHTRPGLWRTLESLPRSQWPSLIRGDIAFGNEAMAAECEERAVPYLFKIKMSRNTRELVRLVSGAGSKWADAGQGWEAVESCLRLQGWSRTRRVVVMRRRLPESRKASAARKLARMGEFLPFLGVQGSAEYEYAVLVTSAAYPFEVIGQLYRDRADAENIYDEMKNQWGWGGFNTQDLARSQAMARLGAQIYNWWNVYARLAVPDKHIEAVTSRPLLLNSVGRVTSHAGQTTVHISTPHAKWETIQRALTFICCFFKLIAKSAERLAEAGVGQWRLILSQAFRSFLKGRLLRPERLERDAERGQDPPFPPPCLLPSG
jgi:hypothetical protein